MRIIVLTPICDARAFTSPAAPRLPSPDWPQPQPLEQFVRCFGPVERRAQGGHEVFPDATFFSSARRAIRLDGLGDRRLGRPPVTLAPECAFRRLFCDGRAVVQVEVGLRDGSRPRRTGPPFTGSDLVAAVLDILELRVRIARFGGDPDETLLADAARPLAALYAEATTTRGVDPARHLVVPGEPLLLVEHERDEVASLPDETKTVDPALVGNVALSFRWLRYRHRLFGVWFLQRSEENRPAARRLRLGLLRLHSEQQVLKRVLALFSSGKIEYVARSPEGEAFDTYLNTATRLLSTDQHAGFSPAALTQIISSYHLVANPEERSLLSAKLAQVRRQIRLKVERQLTPVETAQPAPAEEKGDAIHVFVSYSHKDLKYVQPGALSLLDYLQALRLNKFELWHDERIVAGEPWDDVIRAEIERADIALVLVSQDFLNSRYGQEVEIQRFLEAQRERGLQLCPVILSPCDWRSHPWLASTQFLPRQGTLETDHAGDGPRKQLFLDVLEQLRAIGAKIRGRAGGGIKQASDDVSAA